MINPPCSTIDSLPIQKPAYFLDTVSYVGGEVLDVIDEAPVDVPDIPDTPDIPDFSSITRAPICVLHMNERPCPSYLDPVDSVTWPLLDCFWDTTQGSTCLVPVLPDNLPSFPHADKTITGPGYVYSGNVPIGIQRITLPLGLGSVGPMTIGDAALGAGVESVGLQATVPGGTTGPIMGPGPVPFELCSGGCPYPGVPTAHASTTVVASYSVLGMDGGGTYPILV